MVELSDHGARVGILQEEPHEGVPVVLRRVVRGKEENAGERRNGRDRLIQGDDRTALRNLNAFVDVGARVLARDDVLGRREEPDHADRHERKRQEAREPRPARGGAEPEALTEGERDRGGCRAVRHEQPLETVPVEDRQGERERHRERHAEHDRPERPLFGIECRAAVAVQHRDAEHEGADQPRDEQQLSRLQG